MTTPTPIWHETDFSGDSYFDFSTPVAGLRWNVSVNRYGQTATARLFLMGSGGGPMVAEQVLAIPSMSDANIIAAAQAWATGLIADPMHLVSGLLARVVEAAAESEPEPKPTAPEPNVLHPSYPSDLPTLPRAFPKYVPDEDADSTPCLIEVAPEHRQPRGRWWRPGSAGYTNDLAEAGVYRYYDAVSLCGPCDYPVPARDVLDLHLNRLGFFGRQIGLLIDNDSGSHG